MQQIKLSGQYKKDFKRYKHNLSKVQKLLNIVRMLEHEIEIPSEYKPHKLTGNYKDCMECHIENDFLLIWIDPDSDTIELLRLGSHSELFK
jgi:mRNA interferase YafQ